MARPVLIGVNDKEVRRALKNHKMTMSDMLIMEKPIAQEIINDARMRVPVDTGETKKTISPHIMSATAVKVIDHVGPETHYAPYIELGVPSKPNYPIQSFLRPASIGNIPNITKVAWASVKAFLAGVKKP